MLIGDIIALNINYEETFSVITREFKEIVSTKSSETKHTPTMPVAKKERKISTPPIATIILLRSRFAKHSCIDKFKLEKGLTTRLKWIFRSSRSMLNQDSTIWY